MDVGAVLRILDNLNEPDLGPGRQDPVDIHFQVHSSLDPQLIENLQDLKDQVILFDVIPAFEHHSVFVFLFLAHLFGLRLRCAAQGERHFLRIVHFTVRT